MSAYGTKRTSLVAAHMSAIGRRLHLDTFSIYQRRPLKAARALLGWSQEELATASDVSLPTINRLEAAEGWLAGRQTTSHKIRAALELAGIEFVNENGGGPGVRLRKRQRLKKPK